MNPIPKNGQSLVDLRKRGVVPELSILVSLVGPLDFNNITLQAEAGVSHDWRAIAGLEIEVFASMSVPFSKILRTLADLASAIPARMVLTFVEGPRVDCGEWRQLTDFKLFDWFPMAIGPKAYAEGGKIARKLWAELGHALPIPFDHACDLYVQVAAENQRCD